MQKSPLKDTLTFLKDNKWWWAIPMLTLIALALFLIFLGNPSSDRPFIYSIF